VEQLVRSLARKPHNGLVITCHKAAAIIDIRPDNTLLATLAVAIKYCRGTKIASPMTQDIATNEPRI
jgi:hypothetical protein